MKKYYLLANCLLFIGIAAAGAQTVIHNFKYTNGKFPVSTLALADTCTRARGPYGADTGNRFYGMTPTGGVYGMGSIFIADTNGSNFHELFDFNGTNGAYPMGGLAVRGKKLFGMTSMGGAHDSGCVFSIDTNGGGFKDLLDFNGTNGAAPQGSLNLSKGDSILFGMTELGGANHYGCIFSLDTNGLIYTKIYDFNGSHGANPMGSLTFSVDSNTLWGMSESGGANGKGCIFSIESFTTYNDIYDFNGITGANPYGSLTLWGGVLYGMTESGGANDDGCIFSIDTTGNNYQDLTDFNGTNGSNPYGSLTFYGGNFYGMTSSGGANGIGCFFQVDANGSGYVDILDFTGANGSSPHGSLIMDGNLFYGMAQRGGLNDSGNIFSYNIIKNKYIDRYDFSGLGGEYPYGNLTVSGHTLFGMASKGCSGNGYVFSMDTTGANFKILVNFKGANGATPYGSLMESGGTLFGMTKYGGTKDSGCIFSLDTNGTGYSDLYNFTGSKGAFPYGSLTLSGDEMFGMTTWGGTYGWGTIFSINTDGSNFSDLLDFDITNGINPYGSLTLSGNKLYGMTYFGGGSPDSATREDSGCIFSINTNGKGYSDLLNFNADSGYYPKGSLLLIDSTLYGMNSSGGANGDGNIFSIDTGGKNYHDLLDFNVSNGQFPMGSLTLVKTNLFGMTEKGGGNLDSGCIFMINTAGGGYSDLYNFTGKEGSFPNGSLTWSNNAAYGMATFGGAFNEGTVFILKNKYTGVEEIQTGQQGITILYPNPNNGHFTILVNSEQLTVNSKMQLEVYNVLGKQVYSQFSTFNSQFSIDLSSQPNGIYFYRVLNENGGLVGSGKLIIER